ncbi:MAG: DUF4332 domain-containing protein [Erysipelothrix sp.]|nr:DUF4332 domain-containing protein [Erysipelothrix sp.]
MKLDIVEGIGDVYAQKLMDAGINNTDELLEICKTPAGRKRVADETGISNDLILTWTNHIDLFRINGVREQFAELLEAAGVDTVPELARRNATNLHEKMVEVNEAEKLSGRIPSVNQLTDWIEQAKKLPRVIEY